MDGHGAESDKIDGVWASVRHMESEINVAVASIRAVSREIEDLRDQKLLPELNILIEGYDNISLSLFYMDSYVTNT